MKKLLMAILLLQSMLSVSGQSRTGKLQVSVLDEQKKGVEFVTATLFKAPDTAKIKIQTADLNGLVIFTGLSSGQYMLKLEQLGFVNSMVNILLPDGVSERLETVVLKTDTRMLQETVITAQKSPVSVKDDKLIINVENSVIASGGSAMEVIEKVPGISIDQNDNLTMNGKNGVRIAVNGKLTPLTAAELGNFLRNTSANNIATVEVITNPSSRYDAAGNSGILNIQLKKNNTSGFNGNATLSSGYGRFLKAGSGASLNYLNNKVNLFTTYNYNYNKRYTGMDINRTVTFDNTTTYFNQRNYRPALSGTHNLQAGMEYNPNVNNQLSMNLASTMYNLNVDVSNRTLMSGPGSAVDSSLIMSNDIDTRWKNLSANLNYRHVFRNKGELYIDADYSIFDSKQHDQIRTEFFDETNQRMRNDLILFSDIPSTFNIYSGKADYLISLGKATKLEAGLKASLVNTDNEIVYEQEINGQRLPDNERTNDFRYREMIYAGYISGNFTAGKFKVYTGLRLESTFAEGDSRKANARFNRDNVELFPNLSISREFTRKYKASLSYNRRIDRPAYRDLYPFIFFLDPYTSGRGNPMLKPQLTNTFQLSNNLGLAVINLSYSKTHDFFTDVTIQDDETRVGIGTRENLNNFSAYALSATVPVSITNRWSSSTSLNVFRNSYRSVFLNKPFNYTRISTIASSTHSILFPKKITGEIVASYQGPTVVGFFQRKSNFSLNAGIQKQLLDNKATLRLSATDVFSTSRMVNDIRFANMDMQINNIWESRTIRLNFSYRFGKPAGQVKKRRDGSEDEKKRAGLL